MSGPPLYVAHRGLPRQFPDNSLAGILAGKAVSAMVEIDVRRTVDGVLVLAHDPDFAGLRVRRHTFAELRALSVGGHPIARLDEVLAAVGDFPLNLEIKQNASADEMDPDSQLAREVGAVARTIDLITSFHWPTMAGVRNGYSKLRTGLLVDRRLGIERAISEAHSLEHPLLAVHDPLLGEDPRERVERIGKAGLEVVAWTVNDPARAKLLAQVGVKAIISDVPQMIAS